MKQKYLPKSRKPKTVHTTVADPILLEHHKFSLELPRDFLLHCKSYNAIDIEDFTRLNGWRNRLEQLENQLLHALSIVHIGKKQIESGILRHSARKYV